MSLEMLKKDTTNKVEHEPKILLASNDDQFYQMLKTYAIKEFSVSESKRIPIKNNEPLRSYYTKFEAKIPELSGKQGIIRYYKFQYKITGRISKTEQKIFSDTAIITAENDLNEFIDKYAKNLGGMTIIGPMAEMEMKDVRRIGKTTPFRAKKPLLQKYNKASTGI